MNNFAAIDFETANSERTSVCSVGGVVVRDGVIADSFYSLIQPEPNYYTYWCTRVHGLTQADTETAPVFPHVWERITELIGDLPLVAHNSPFDESCLKAVFRCYQMDYHLPPPRLGRCGGMCPHSNGRALTDTEKGAGCL